VTALGSRSPAACANIGAMLSPVPYHAELRKFLKAHEAELWEWLASAEAKAAYADELRLDLLKSLYRFEPAAHPLLYAQVENAKAALGLNIPVTIYQGQQSGGMNAGIYYLPGEGHIAFNGNLLQLLKDDELLCVLAHELAHYQLWQAENGEYHVMDRLVRTLAQSPRSAPSHHHTAKMAQLYTEIFCDRASALATGSLESMIRSLIKIETGITDVSAESYLQQAEEIFRQGAGPSERISHPETYIRVRALSLWMKDPATAEEQIVAMIEGVRSVDELDLLGQRRMSDITRGLVDELLQPEWFRTDPVLAHARLFFPDFVPGGRVPETAPAFAQDDKTKEYLGYVMLDFTAMDPELEEEPLKQAVRVAERWGLGDSFAKLAQKELKLKARDWARLTGVEK
jgi:predicted SprT family Zn-dependent metalloprotease